MSRKAKGIYRNYKDKSLEDIPKNELLFHFLFFKIFEEFGNKKLFDGFKELAICLLESGRVEVDEKAVSSYISKLWFCLGKRPLKDKRNIEDLRRKLLKEVLLMAQKRLKEKSSKKSNGKLDERALKNSFNQCFDALYPEAKWN